MNGLNPKMINALRHAPHGVARHELAGLYGDQSLLEHDLGALQRHALVTVAGGHVAWAGS